MKNNGAAELSTEAGIRALDSLGVPGSYYVVTQVHFKVQ